MATKIKPGDSLMKFTLSTSLKTRLKKQAKKQNVSLAQLMRDISQKYLKEVK